MSQQVTIREAQDPDVPRIVEMIGHFITDRYSHLFDVQPARLEELVGLVRRVGVILVVSRDRAPEELVGFVAGAALQEPIAGIPLLDEMAWWLEPGYRKGRLGHYLLRSFEDWARQKGLSMVKMVAPAGSSVGNYYTRMGYEQVETSYIKRL